VPSSKPPRPEKVPASTSTSSDDLVVAQVLSAHGIRGELKCRVVTDFPEQRFKRGNTVLLDGVPHSIASARMQPPHILIRLNGVADRDAAQALRGKELTIRKEDAVALPDGQFFWNEVIGLSVVNATTAEVLGEVVDILETGANDVYVVRPARGREILIPAIKDVVKEIDPKQGRMVVEPLPGM
jgi:16S rRNA processing protein RimM